MNFKHSIAAAAFLCAIIPMVALAQNLGLPSNAPHVELECAEDAGVLCEVAGVRFERSETLVYSKEAKAPSAYAGVHLCADLGRREVCERAVDKHTLAFEPERLSASKGCVRVLLGGSGSAGCGSEDANEGGATQFCFVLLPRRRQSASRGNTRRSRRAL